MPPRNKRTIRPGEKRQRSWIVGVQLLDRTQSSGLKATTRNLLAQAAMRKNAVNKFAVLILASLFTFTATAAEPITPQQVERINREGVVGPLHLAIPIPPIPEDEEGRRILREAYAEEWLRVTKPTAGEIATWKVAYDREQARLERRRLKKSGKPTKVDQRPSHKKSGQSYDDWYRENSPIIPSGG